MSKKCLKCLLPDGKHGNFSVELNKEGLCNYCVDYNNNYRNFFSDESVFKEKIANVKGKFKYDALVGLSGGKDSSYVLYKLVKKYKLNVLAITCALGTGLTEYAENNIQRIVKSLGIEHVYLKIEDTAASSLMLDVFKVIGNPCAACSIGGYLFLIKYCYDHKIPFFIHGRSPFQMYRNYTKDSTDSFLKILQLNKALYSYEDIKNNYNEMFHKMKKLFRLIALDKEDAEKQIKFLLPNKEQLADNSIAPEFLSYFIYHPYNEEKMKQELEKANIGWERPTDDTTLGHADCKFHDVAGYIYKELTGIDVVIIEIASMLRFRKINQQQAEELFDKNNIQKVSKENIEKSKNHFCTAVGITIDNFDSILNKLKIHRANIPFNINGL